MTHKAIRDLSVLSLLVLLFAAGCSQSSNVESRLERVQTYLADEDYSAAEIELKNVLREDPRNAEAIASMGRVYFKQGRFREALPFLNTAKTLAPEDIETRLNLASLMAVAGRPDLAMEEARFVLGVDPTNAKAPLVLADSIRSPEAVQQGAQILSSLEKTAASLTALGSIDLKRQALSAAEAKFDQALELDPEFGPAYAGKYAIQLFKGNQEEATEFLRQAAEHSESRSGMNAVYAAHLSTQKGEVEKAIAHLESVREDAPDFLPIMGQLAELYAQTGRTKEAKELSQKALSMDPIDPTSLRLKGVLAASEEKYDEAIEILENAVKLYPNDIKANYQLALSYIAKQQPEKAKEPLKVVHSINPGNFEAAALLANIQANEGDHSGAIITLKQLVTSQPNSPQAKLMLAEAFNKQGNFDAALALYQEVDNALPEDPDLDYLSGVTQLRRENRTEARQAFEEALKSNPLHLQSVEQLTALDLSEGSYESALKRTEQSLELAPDSAILHIIKAQVLQAMKRRDEAESAYLKGLELEPNNRIARILLSRFYVAQDQPDKAKEQLRHLIDNAPNDVPALINLAGLYEREGNYGEAIKLYEQAVETAPNNLASLNNLAYLISIEEGPTDRAKELAERARQVAPTSPYTADTLGWILFQRGEYARARALLLDSLARLPENPEVNYHAGAASYVLGNKDDAKRFLETATSGDPQYTGLEDARQKLRVLNVNATSLSSDDRSLIETLAAENDPMALVVQGSIHEADGKTEEAIKQYRKAFEAYPDNLTAKLELALALATHGSAAEAVEIGRAAAKQAPNNIEVTYVQGVAAFQAGDYAWASSLLTQAARQLPNRARLHFYLSRARLATGALPEAIESADRAANLFSAEADKSEAAAFGVALRMLSSGDIESPPSDIPENSLLGRLLQAKQVAESGNSDEAKTRYESIISEYPNQAQAKLALAELLIDTAASPDRAYALAGESRSALGSDARILAIQAAARYQQGQYDQASRLFGQLPSGGLSDPKWSFYQGMTALETDRPTEAKAHLEKALQGQLPADLQSKAQEALTAIGNP